MSFKAMKWAFDLPPDDPKLTGIQKLVLLAIANYYSDTKRECFPSLDRIARDSCISRSTVQSAIDRLKAVGVLTVTKRRRGESFVNFYGLPTYREPVGGSDFHVPDDEFPPTDSRNSNYREPVPNQLSTNEEPTDKFLLHCQSHPEYVNDCGACRRAYAKAKQAKRDNQQHQTDAQEAAHTAALERLFDEFPHLKDIP